MPSLTPTGSSPTAAHITQANIDSINGSESSSKTSTSSAWTLSGFTAFLGKFFCTFKFGKSNTADAASTNTKDVQGSSNHVPETTSTPLKVKSSSWFSRFFGSSSITTKGGPEKFITEAASPVNSDAYIRINSDKELCFTSNNETKTSYLTRGRENEAIAHHVIELFRQKFGNEGAAIAKAVLHDDEIGFRKEGYISASMINCIHDNIMTERLPKLMESAIQESTPKSTEEVLRFFSPEKTATEKLTILSSGKTVSLSEKGAGLSYQLERTTIDTLPEAYCCVLGKEERKEVLGQKNGLTDIVKKQVNTNVAEKISERTSSGWSRVQIKINGKIFPYLKNGAFNTDDFKKEIQQITGEEPSDDQVLEMLTLMDNDGRFAGFSPLGSSRTRSGLSLGEEARSSADAEKETMAISYSQEAKKWTFNYSSSDSYLKRINPPGTDIQLELYQPKNENAVTQLFKMRRFSSVEYTPPANDQKIGDAISSRLEITDSREGFFLDTPKNNFDAYGLNAVL